MNRLWSLFVALFLVSLLGTLQPARCSNYGFNAQVSGSLTVTGNTVLASSVQLGSNSYSFPASAPSSVGQLLTAGSTASPYTLAWQDPPNLLAVCPVTVGLASGCVVDVGISDQSSGDTVGIANFPSTGTNRVRLATAPGLGGTSEVTIGAQQGSSFTKIYGGSGGILLDGPVAAGSAAASFDFSTSTQPFQTSSATVNLNGDTTLANGKSLIFSGLTSGSISFAPAATSSGSYTLPDSPSDGYLLNTGSTLSWSATAAASCLDIGSTSGCTMGIGVGSSSGSDSISIANTAQPSPLVSIATGATTAATVSIGSSIGASKVTLTAGSGGINLAGDTTVGSSKTLFFSASSSGAVGIQGPSGTATSYNFQLPKIAPTTGQLLGALSAGPPATTDWLSLSLGVCFVTVDFQQKNTGQTDTRSGTCNLIPAGTPCFSNPPTDAASQSITCTATSANTVQLVWVSGAGSANPSGQIYTVIYYTLT